MPLPAPAADPRRDHLRFLIAAAFLLLLFGTGHLPLIDRDEPRFAEATREMMQRHDWLVPTFNGDYRFDKPPLTYWVMAGFYQVFGAVEIAARLHSILSTVALVVLVWWMGRRWFSPGVGFAAGLGLLTSLQILLHGRLAVADMPMVLAVAVAQYALYQLLTADAAEPAQRRGWFWALYLALAAGFLAKGPIALAVPLGTALLFRFAFWRRPLPWARLRLGWGLALVLLLVGLWGIPGLIETHGLWWKVGMDEHVVARGLEPLNSRHYFLPYYLCSALLSYFPWIALAGYGVVVLRRQWNQRNAFLLAWLVTPYLIFLGYATQLPHYILPAFPAFFLILAQAADLRPLPRWPGRLAVGLLIFLALPVAALLLVAGVAPWQAALLPLRQALIGVAMVLGALIALAVLVLRGKVRWAVPTIVTAGMGFLLIGFGLRPLLPAIAVADRTRALPPETRCVAAGYTEGSLVFYTGRHWTMASSPKEYAEACAQPGPVIGVQLAREIKIDWVLRWLTARLTGHPAELRVEETPTVGDGPLISGINFARASWVTIRLETRQP
jgi:4-amino-4-deoxy-L-arabinose transferase-like glycosyltransferase